MYTILVVEDDPDQSRPFTQMLKYRGYNVLHAYNGEDALSTTLVARPNLVIVDLLLVQYGDGIDGYELIRRIRHAHTVSSVAILAWTGHYVDEKDEIRALRLGADDYVNKSVSFGALEARIEALLRRVTRNSSEDGLHVD